ncbi:glycosyltransferase family 39 protein [Roseomonas gilardii subsp. gilardii]|uniref:ArnT family glycosyltransferase n=1 Tax=Roseomonas gilardii TaxID=257708 RepID=UPI001FF84478|nr:glycosyltransferase family 39 protein [Roseomonas gilardii]UPG71506.1 glycosyltransferase family 39 protein [Roseomonas gilardii subsp. gilardii]
MTQTLRMPSLRTSSLRLPLLALAAITLARLIAAATVPVSPDEAYYWVWSRALAPGYYDHPPMVAFWIRAGTLLLGDTPLGIRLLGPIGLLLATLALARAGNLLFPDRRPGVVAASLFNATLLVNAGAVLMTPDTPQIVFWCLTLWAVAEAHARGDGRWWFAVGLLAGCALLSKYTAAFLGIGLLLWLLLDARARVWLRDWRLWAGGVVAVLLFSPVLIWNAQHGWASFAKQGGRAGLREGGFTFRYLGELIGGQAGLATPVIFALCVIGTALAVSAWVRRRDSGAGLLVALTVPATAIFLWQATGSRVQGNWPAILYPTACLAAACLGPAWQRLRRPALALGLAISGLVLVQAAAAPLHLERRNDPTLARLGGWDRFAEAVEQARVAQGADFVASEEYGLASELALRLPRGVPVVAIGDRWDLFTLPDGPVPVRGLLIRSTRRGEGPPLWPGATELPGLIARARGGVEAELYRLYAVSPAPDLSVALLPRPR